MIKNRTRRFKQIAFALSICLFALWGLLGTSTSIAWFSDTSEELKNIFHFAEFDLQVFYKNDKNEWEEIKNDTALFDEEALYEPGYVQVVYLKVKNNGTVPFKWKTTVRVDRYSSGINVYGDELKLQEYLKFGVVQNDSEAKLYESLSERSFAKEYANEELNEYSKENGILDANKEAYLALIVRMPEEVTNVANYKPPHQPEVFLGLVVTASQISQ